MSSSASVAQVIPLAAAPLLTRLYTPAEFGIYAAVSTGVLIVSTVAGGRYDMAIVLADSASDAVLLVSVCMRIAAVSCGLATGALIVALWLGPELRTGIGWWLAMVPAITLATTWSTALTQYALHHDDVRAVFAAGLLKAAVVVLIQLGLGLLGAGAVGLLTATGIAAVAGSLGLWGRYRADRWAGRNSNRRQVARRYARFPRSDVAASLLNSGATGIGVFGVAAVFSPAVVGWYSLATRVGTLPATTVGAAIGRVYYRQAAIRAAAGQPLRPYLRRTAILTAAASLPVFALLMLASPTAFALLFGQEWREAGAFVVAMVPLLWLRIVVSPVSSTLLVTGRHGANVLWHVMLVLATAGCLLTATLLGLSPVGYLWLTTAVVGAVYVGLFLLAYASTGTRQAPPHASPATGPVAVPAGVGSSEATG